MMMNRSVAILAQDVLKSDQNNRMDQSDTDDDDIFDGRSLNTFIRKLAQTSLTMATHTVKAMTRWCCVLFFFMETQINALTIRKGEFSDPSFVSYQSDGWSAFVSDTEIISVDGHRVTRRGRAKREFLLERAVYKTITPSGEIKGYIMARPPRPMTEGCGGWEIFAASTSSCPMLRRKGHEGMAASHYLQDGLHSEEFLQHHRANHQLYYDTAQFDDPDDRTTQENSDLVFGGKCKLHTGSNAIKWAMSSHSSEQILKDIHNAMKSLTNTHTEIRKHITSFYVKHVSHEAGHTLPWETRKQFFTAMGVASDMLENFERVNPWWDTVSKTLFVNPDLKNDPDGQKRVEQLLLYAATWSDFSETRFGAIGSCGRAWVLSQALGLDSLANLTLQDPAVIKFFLRGYGTHCTEKVRRWLAIASLAFYPAESMMMSLLEDDRFYKRANELWADISVEHEYVNQLNVDVFREIVRVTGLPDTVEEFRHDTLRAMNISVCFISVECFEEMRCHPLDITQGDIEAKVRALAAEPDPPTDPTTRQMWTRMRDGLHIDFVVRTMTLVKDAPCTTLLSEQGRCFTTDISLGLM